MPAIPPLFHGSLLIYLLCLLILIGGQVIYATVGFGAGMFAVTLLVILLDDLQGVVSTLLLLTWITEVLVLSREWRYAWRKLLFVIVPPLFVGVFFGTKLLASGSGEALKIVLGIVMALAGLHFLASDIRSRRAEEDSNNASSEPRRVHPWMVGAGIPAALASGVLGACFGTGGPPIIVLFKSMKLDKRLFRATILSFFFATSVSRITTGIWLGTLGMDNVRAAIWLVPGSIIGTILGAKIYKRLSEQHFARTVSILITLLGLTLVIKSL